MRENGNAVTSPKLVKMIQKGYSASPPPQQWFCGLVGVLGYPFSTPVLGEWCPETPMSRGAGSPQFYPTLPIIHASRPVSTTWQASQQQEQGLFTVYFLVNIYLLAQGPPPRQASSPRLHAQAAAWEASC